VTGLFKANKVGVVPSRCILFLRFLPILDFFAARQRLVLSVGDVTFNPLFFLKISFELLSEQTQAKGICLRFATEARKKICLLFRLCRKRRQI
jgi:hypothetical protein